MSNERVKFPNVGRFFSKDLLPAIRDVALEPLRCSEVLKEKLTDTSLIPNYKDLDRATRAMVQIRGYMWGSLPMVMPITMMASELMQGDVAGGLLIGSGVWMAEGAFLKVTRTRKQS